MNSHAAYQRRSHQVDFSMCLFKKTNSSFPLKLTVESTVFTVLLAFVLLKNLLLEIPVG